MRKLLVVAALSVSALLFAPALAGAHFVQQDRAEVLDYWTPKRMANAQPAELLAIGGGSTNRATVAASDGSRYAVAAPTAPGTRTHGKVFLTIPGLGDFICSATVIDSFSRSLVATAGHCVSEGTNFAENWMFVPAYENGNEPFGRWTAAELAAPAGWKASGDLRFDVGLAKVGPNGGSAIQDVVGARGIAFNQPRGQLYESFGYPASQPPFEFNGEREFACTSSWRGDDVDLGTPQPMKIACDMTAGSSGGGWVANGNLLSVNSYKNAMLAVIDQRFMFGPYFGDEIRSLYGSMGGGEVLCAASKQQLDRRRAAVSEARKRLRGARKRVRAAGSRKARKRAKRIVKRRSARLERTLERRQEARAALASCRAGNFS